MSEQLFGTRSVFGLYEDAPDEVSGLIRDVRRQRWVRGLRGYFKDGCHSLVFGPGGLLCQHFHHGAAKTPKQRNTRTRTRKQPHTLSYNVTAMKTHPGIAFKRQQRQQIADEFDLNYVMNCFIPATSLQDCPRNKLVPVITYAVTALDSHQHRLFSLS